jgi:hypothetical protein
VRADIRSIMRCRAPIRARTLLRSPALLPRLRINAPLSAATETSDASSSSHFVASRPPRRRRR